MLPAWVAPCCGVTGAALFLSGVVCFFAYNWDALGLLLKFALPLAGLLLCGGGAYYKGPARGAGHVLSVGAGLFLGIFWKRVLKLNAVEQCSVIYSNAGNLIIPLVIAVLGPEWVIYSSTFLAVQLVLFWTHMKSTMAREPHMDWKAVFTNANMIAIFIGLILLFTGWRMPAPVNDAFHALGLVIGPSAMIIAGMLLGNMSWEKIKSYKRVPLVAFLRLIVMPLMVLVFLKYSGLASFSPDGETILLITLLATATPSATTCVSMASLFDNQPEYASVINVVTATLCTITMPFIVWIYQL